MDQSRRGPRIFSTAHRQSTRCGNKLILWTVGNDTQTRPMPTGGIISNRAEQKDLARLARWDAKVGRIVCRRSFRATATTIAGENAGLVVQGFPA